MNDDENAEVEKLFEKDRRAKATGEEVDSSEILRERDNVELWRWVKKKRDTLPTVSACHERDKKLDRTQWPDFIIPVENPTFGGVRLPDEIKAVGPWSYS